MPPWLHACILDNVITSGWVLKDLQPPEEMTAVELL
jgi:hypothetical protein